MAPYHINKKILTNRNSSDWYENHIEEPLRDLVRYLRNNGVNTECSCAHENPMYIQCQYFTDGAVDELKQLLHSYFHQHDKKINYKIIVNVENIDGKIFSGIDIEIPNENNHIDYWERMKRYHLRRAREYHQNIKNENRAP